ncbi:MAG: VWA domain-containing protein [Candidatus Aureabacteria bacterium]|nr:VWA domain-containing protein [Candidatus Auribacterota bacterium]
MITFLQPFWIIFIIPVMMLWYFRSQPSKLLNFLRFFTLIFFITASCKPSIKSYNRTGTIVVLADRSLSMPENGSIKQKEIIDLLQKNARLSGNVAVVSFGRNAAVEQHRGKSTFSGFINNVGKDQSQLSLGLKKALNLIPENVPGKILILSDGKWTGKNPLQEAVSAATRGVAIDYRLIERKRTRDTAIFEIIAPVNIPIKQSYMITAWIHSPIKQEIQYELKRSSRVISSGKKFVNSGLNRLIFRDIAKTSGTYSYIMSISGSVNDPIPENNQARFLVSVKGERSILCVSRFPDSSLAALLKKGGLKVDKKTPSECSFSFEELSQYSGVILENIPAETIGLRGMENIALWIENSGKGLMMTGGKNAYAPGGYFRSPLEKIMPVSMELRQEHRKILVSIVVVLDRSGSMAVGAGDGKTKMDLANIGTVQVLDLLSPMDEIGVIAVDSAPHVIVDIDTVENNDNYRNKILQINSEGGGIYVYEALRAAAKMLLKSKMETRHIVLFSDANDTEQPGEYKELLEKCQKANITVSVIGLGKETDVDAELLKDIALKGSGQCFFTDNPFEIPRLFAQDTFTIARSSFIEDSTEISSTGALATLTGRKMEIPYAIGGYNLCYTKPDAIPAVVTKDEYNAPVVASWQAGSGRVLCYTGEADGSHTGPIAKWDKIGDFYTSLARWSAGETKTLPGNIMTTEKIENGEYVIDLHLESNRKSNPFHNIPQLILLRGDPGKKPYIEKLDFKWVTPDRLSLGIQLKGNETVLPTLDLSDKRFVLSPLCLPYSPEYKLTEENKGSLTLKNLASITQGEELIDISNIWDSIPEKILYKDISRWFLLLAALLFFLEILHRRTGLLLFKKQAIVNEQKTEEENVKKNKKQEVSFGPAKGSNISKPVKIDKSSTLDAMQKASRAARKRTKRDL